MQTYPTFRLSQLALVLSTLTLAHQSHAVYNLYNNEGLTFDIHGQVDVQATKSDKKHQILHDADGINWFRGTGSIQTNMPSVVASTDKAPRLGQTHGVSFVEFRGSQTLPNQTWRVTGNVALGYTDASNLYLSNSSLSLDKKNTGAITFGRQYLHTNYVGRTGTDTPLDTFSKNALRVDYYATKGLWASAYYSFAEVSDVRVNSNAGIHSGFGVSASYRHQLTNNHSVRVGAGFSQANAKPAAVGFFSNTGYNFSYVDNPLNKNPEKKQGVAGSLEYQMGSLLVAADIGRKHETMAKDVQQVYNPELNRQDNALTVLDSRTTDYAGVKIAYDINPVLQVSAGYGTKKATTKLKEGYTPLTTEETLTADDFSYVDADDTSLFDKADSTETYVQADYRVRPNVRLYARYDNETTTYKVADKNISKVTDNNVRAGLVFSF